MAENRSSVAFVLDVAHVQASEDGMTVPPLPGLWRNDVAIHPDALGLTLAEMRDLVDKLSLPLVEVKDSKALREFPRSSYLAPSEETYAPLGGGERTAGPESLDVDRAELAAADPEGEAE